jgi:hypothetical protein
VKIVSAERPRVSWQYVVSQELVVPKLILNRLERKGNRFIFLYLEARYSVTNGGLVTEVDSSSGIVVPV